MNPHAILCGRDIYECAGVKYKKGHRLNEARTRNPEKMFKGVCVITFRGLKTGSAQIHNSDFTDFLPDLQGCQFYVVEKAIGLDLV